ncbi:TonB-dependent receptor domain-containing protein [Tenacibaculum singaporense]|uniref:TonB-dependent receptor n=1 Tax=Tenacibaculum singaporense TaxID=2358479 RepID=A0A3Q8RNM0_9FLAO|nr:TonB-dependent receptor [Tenacibaculum singaporense]AZJ35992.1 TonB-dependent receptor [Tenacibaculum singaporense]
MKSKRIILILLLLLSYSNVKGQNCKHTFSGLVEDFHDKSPIVGATVFIKNQNKYVVTDFQGKFSIPKVCSGKIIVEISHVACDPQTLELNISADIYKIIDLEHHEEELNEVNVKGAIGLKTKTAQETLIKTQTLEKFSGASLGDALKNITGVSSINTGNSIVKPVINGLNGSRVLVSFNNVRLQDQEWGIEHAPNIDVNAAKTISVVKGANALQYGGDAIGGVVIINPVKSVIDKDTLYGKSIISQQTNGRLFSVTTSLNKSYKSGWFVNGQASFKRAGDFEAANYNLSNTGINSKAFTFNIGKKQFEKGFELFYSYLSNEIGILRASHFGNVADLVDAIESPIPLFINDFSYDIDNPKQDVTHHLLKAAYYKRFKGLGKLSLQYDFQFNNRLEFDRRIGDNKNLQAVDLDLTTHNFKSDFQLDSNPNHLYKFGLSALYQDNFPDPITKVRRLIPDYKRFSFGSYAIADFKFDDLVFSAGIRYDLEHIDAKKFYLQTRWDNLNYQNDFSHIIIDPNAPGSQLLTNPKFTYHNVSTSLGLTYNLDAKNSFIVNYGLANRAPNPSELFSDGLHHSAARIEIGDLRMQTETSNRFSASYMYNSDKLNITVEGFYNHIKDFIYIEPTGEETTNRGAFPVWSYKQVNAQLFGVDTNISFQPTNNIVLTNKSSLLKGKDLSGNRPLIDIPPFKTVTSLVFKKENWKNFYASIESEFNAEQNEFPNNNFQAYLPLEDRFVTVDVSTPPSAYHLLNFSTGLDFKLSKTKLNLNFSVDNILNESYRNYLNRLRYFADDLGRNFKIQLKINY